MVKRNCFGCVNDNKPSQKEHMFFGCLDDPERLLEYYGKDCHLSITPGRLMAALTVMCGQYKIKNDQTKESVVQFLNSVNYYGTFHTQRDFVDEYNMINEL